MMAHVMRCQHTHRHDVAACTPHPCRLLPYLAAPQAEMVPGVVNFYAGVLDLGQLTCRLLLKEYPTTTRSLGVNEIRAYGEARRPPP